MCYSAMVKQDLKSLVRSRRAAIDYRAFEAIFKRRIEDDSIRIGKALEANFRAPESAEERRIAECIRAHHDRMATHWQAELFRQKKRLADAGRSLRARETKKALEDRRIATNKIGWYTKKLADLKRTDLKENDARIFPFWYAPVLVREAGETVIRPMRYHCRPHGRPASYDQRFPGLYNARRDNLERFWREQFGHHHAICVVTSFYENVARHDFEKRTLEAGETEENLVLHFNPTPPVEMLIACLWDCWQEQGKSDLYSFAAITDDPPHEVAATGHNRCIIPVKPANVGAWLDPESLDSAALFALLDDRERPYYAHELAA